VNRLKQQKKYSESDRYYEYEKKAKDRIESEKRKERKSDLKEMKKLLIGEKKRDEVVDRRTVIRVSKTPQI
jgi:hypothetical protein